MTEYKRKLALLLVALVVLTTTFTGCSNEDNVVNASSQIAATTPEPTIIPMKPDANALAVPAGVDSALELPDASTGLNATQLNSINMLNYLVMLTQEINASKNSRLYLEEAYSTLLNNTSPEVVDNRTLVEINYLLDTLESYRMIAVKRDRIQYIYEQNQAQAVRDAMPNPLGLMSAVQSFSLSKLVASVAYMALDSYTSYQSSSAQADMQYLQDGWALDDQEASTLHEIRKGTFNYMIETVRDYELPGDLSLTEQAVADFVEWKNKTNTLQVIQFFEDNVETYQAFGPYWLTLAHFYYQNNDFAKCLSAITTYEKLETQIFRRDYSYAKVLPLAIVAAREALPQAQYVEIASLYAQSIMDNTNNNEWALRYFATQTYIELYHLTGDETNLSKAYDISLRNVTYLLDEQRSLNAAYMAEVQEAIAEKGATKAQQEEVKQYNKMLKEERKTALPPVYEPLLLNCELLFTIADELGISENEALKIEGILHENGDPLFLALPLDSVFSQNSTFAPSELIASITFDGSKLSIPAQAITDNAEIRVTVSYNGESTVFDDWMIEKVDRKTKDDSTSFVATFSSKAAQSHAYAAGAMLHIEVLPKAGSAAPVLSCHFEAIGGKTLHVFDRIEFQKVEE